MPILTMSDASPLSKAWTHEDVVSEALVITNQLDNERVQLYNVRVHMNIAISNIADMLNLANMPWYNVWLQGDFEDELHPTGLHYIDLKDITLLSEEASTNRIDRNKYIKDKTHDSYIQNFIPSRDLKEIVRLNVPKTQSIVGSIGTQLSGIAVWDGNFSKKDISELTELQTTKNIQYRHSICWSHSGSDLLFFVGDQIVTKTNFWTKGFGSLIDLINGSNLSDTIAYTMVDEDLISGPFSYPITLVGMRKPELDDLKAPEQSNTYKQPVDLPDEYMDLLVKKVQKFVLTQLREQVPAQLEQEINQQQMLIQKQINDELQYEQAERQKMTYGYGQRPPGAM